MENSTQIWLLGGSLTITTGVCGYFMSRFFDAVDDIKVKLEELTESVTSLKARSEFRDEQTKEHDLILNSLSKEVEVLKYAVKKKRPRNGAGDYLED